MTVVATEARGSTAQRTEFLMHLAVFVAAAVVLGLSFSMSVVDSSLVYLPGWSIPLPESCTARMFLGIACPGCGLTRAFISISNGHFSDAWNFNPASYLFYLFVLVQLPWQICQMTRNLAGKASIDSLWIYVLPISTAVGLLLQWLYRMLP